MFFTELFKIKTMPQRLTSTDQPLRLTQDIRSRLQVLVNELSQRSEFALARIWLIDAGDLCTHCFLRDQCADRRACLHLVASAGCSRLPQSSQAWDRLDGTFRRLPLNVQKIGRIGATGEPLVIPRIGDDGGSLMHRQWAADEHIRGFFGYPLHVQGVISGVFAVFSRVALNELLITLLQTLANTAAEMVAQAASRSQLQLKSQFLALESEKYLGAPVVTSCSAAARKLETQIQLAARFGGAALIAGEQGTDLREVARRIHEAGSQNGHLLFAVEGSRFCEQFLDDDPFFADRLPAGTLLLENLDRVSPERQKSLANALSHMSGVSQQGHPRTKILASLSNSSAGNVTGRLQHDLHCLLSVLCVEIPPLADRRDDLCAVSHRVLGRLQQRYGRAGLRLAEDELLRMQQYAWPGNDRELELLLERALLRLPLKEMVIRNVLGTSQFGLPDDPQGAVASEDRIRHWQRENLLVCLEQCHWKIYGDDGAAARVGIKPTTLISRMKKLGIKKP